MCRFVAERAAMLKNDKTASAHHTPGCRVVMLEHFLQGLPDQLEVFGRKAGLGGDCASMEPQLFSRVDDLTEVCFNPRARTGRDMAYNLQ